jgi:hypothetical protein
MARKSRGNWSEMRTVSGKLLRREKDVDWRDFWMLPK